jgi:hypothetical protein
MGARWVPMMGATMMMGAHLHNNQFGQLDDCRLLSLLVKGAIYADRSSL